MISVPDDFPSVFEGTPAHEQAKKLGDVAVFTERGADQEQELIRRIGRATIAINIRAHARFTDGVFAACPALKMVSIWGTGTDNFDLNAAGMRGVTICNTPGVNAFAVAEHTLTLMLAVGRKIVALDAEMRKNKWPRELLTQMLGKTLGVFGMGAIGARVAALGKAIGMNVLGWSATGDPARIRAAGATPATKEEILSRADVISLNVRLTPETRGFIGRKELAQMKPTAILINTGRGALVEKDARSDPRRIAARRGERGALPPGQAAGRGRRPRSLSAAASRPGLFGAKIEARESPRLPRLLTISPRRFPCPRCSSAVI